MQGLFKEPIQELEIEPDEVGKKPTAGPRISTDV